MKANLKGKLRAIAFVTISPVILTLVLIYLYGKYSDIKAGTYMGDLSTDNPVIQQIALRKIGAVKDKAKLTNRITLIFYNDSNIRSVIVNRSIGCLQNRNADTVIETLKMLGKVQDKNAVPFLIKLLNGENTPDKDTAVKALEALGKIKDPAAVQVISNFLHSKDQAVRITSIWALGNIGDKKAVSLLRPLLQDNDKYIRYQAFVALRKIG